MSKDIDDGFYKEAPWISKRNFGHEYAELKKKKIPESLNLGVMLKDNSGCIITEWVQNFKVRKSGVLDGTQLYVLTGRFLCFLSEETVQLAAEDRKDEDDELEDEDFEEVLEDEN